MNVLIVEDEYITCEYFSQHIKKKFNHTIDVAHSKKEATEMAEKLRPSIIFMDIAMETKTAGIEACKEIKAKYPETKIFMVSAYTESTYQNELKNCPYNGYIDKTSFTRVADKYL